MAALMQQKHQLFLFDMQRREWKKLHDDATGDDVNWSADSKYVYTSRPIGDKPEIVRVPVGAGKEQSVVDLRSFGDLTGSVDAWFTLAPDGSILLLRTNDQPEIYALNWTEK